jgi:hypothetical protein
MESLVGLFVHVGTQGRTIEVWIKIFRGSYRIHTICVEDHVDTAKGGGWGVKMTGRDKAEVKRD